MQSKKNLGGAPVGNKNGHGNKGKIFSRDHRKNLSIALTGKKRTEEEKKKLSLYWQGKKRPELSGKNHWNWQDGKSTRQARRRGNRAKYCEACGQDGRIVYDHDHKTGIFRGWLCNNCNVALGLLKDCPERLLNLKKYLENHQNYHTLGRAD